MKYKQNLSKLISLYLPPTALVANHERDQILSGFALRPGSTRKSINSRLAPTAERLDPPLYIPSHSDTHHTSFNKSVSMYRLPSLRHAAGPARRRLALPAFVAPMRFARAYATPSGQPRPSDNSPTPAGLESVFGGGPRRGPPPAPRNGENPSEPHKEPETPGKDNDTSEWKDRRPRLSDDPNMKKKAATAGGGGGGGSGGSGGSGGPGQNFGGMTPNQLILAVISTYALYSLTSPGGGSSREITWQEL